MNDDDDDEGEERRRRRKKEEKSLARAACYIFTELVESSSEFISLKYFGWVIEVLSLQKQNGKCQEHKK